MMTTFCHVIRTWEAWYIDNLSRYYLYSQWKTSYWSFWETYF